MPHQRPTEYDIIVTNQTLQKTTLGNTHSQILLPPFRVLVVMNLKECAYIHFLGLL